MSTDKEWQDFFTMVDQDIQKGDMSPEEASARWKKIPHFTFRQNFLDKLIAEGWEPFDLHHQNTQCRVYQKNDSYSSARYCLVSDYGYAWGFGHFLNLDGHTVGSGITEFMPFDVSIVICRSCGRETTPDKMMDCTAECYVHQCCDRRKVKCLECVKGDRCYKIPD